MGPKKFIPKPAGEACEFPTYRLPRSPDLVARYKLFFEHRATLSRINAVPKSQVQIEAFDDFLRLPKSSDLELLDTARGFI